MSHSPFYKFYYAVKPYLPRRLRIAMRRKLAAWQLGGCASEWPILESAAEPPPGWTGWPEEKRFALVLTHDVESARGVARCRQLARLESNLGLRSSFNFIPEGDHEIPETLRHELVASGFEIGVHDLRHDGGLYSSHQQFQKNAGRINHYLKKWEAVGFRSGFMFHNLDWLHELDVLYDASTFDTDPFEPQPEGVGTLFPFWVPSPNEAGRGYVELPYTLAQDFTAHVLLAKSKRDFWMTKLDWIAARGGMALVITHPDYMSFDRNCRFDEFPAHIYEQFLSTLVSKYRGQFWQALPCDVAAWWKVAVEAGQHVNTPVLEKLRRAF